MKNKNIKKLNFLVSFLLCFIIISCDKPKQTKEKNVDTVPKQKTILKSHKVKASYNKNNNSVILKNKIKSENKNLVSTDSLQNELQSFQDALNKAELNEDEFYDSFANKVESALNSQIIDWTPAEWEAIKQNFYLDNNCTNFISGKFMILLDNLYSTAGKVSKELTEKICDLLLEIAHNAKNKEFGVQLMNRIGSIQSKIQNYETAFNIAEKSFNTYLEENISNPRLICFSGMRMIDSCGKLGEFEKMEDVVQKWKKMADNKNIEDDYYFKIDEWRANMYLLANAEEKNIIKGITILKELINKLDAANDVSEFTKFTIKDEYNNWKNHPAYNRYMQNKDDNK